jgi:hypothetical protein
MGSAASSLVLLCFRSVGFVLLYLAWTSTEAVWLFVELALCVSGRVSWWLGGCGSGLWFLWLLRQSRVCREYGFKFSIVFRDQF